MTICCCSAFLNQKNFSRNRNHTFSKPFLSWLTGCIILFGSFCAPVYGEGAAADICRLIPGDKVARAIEGKLLEAKSFEKRCLYIVGFKEATLPEQAFIIYSHDAGEYESLKNAMEGEQKPLSGLGDKAVIGFDAESTRYWLLIGKNGHFTLQVSGADEGMVRKVGASAVDVLAP